MMPDSYMSYLGTHVYCTHMQGGDPTGTGTGGASVYGKPFWDEFDSRLSHSGRGILAMANRCAHPHYCPLSTLILPILHSMRNMPCCLMNTGLPSALMKDMDVLAVVRTATGRSSSFCTSQLHIWTSNTRCLALWWAAWTRSPRWSACL